MISVIDHPTADQLFDCVIDSFQVRADVIGYRSDLIIQAVDGFMVKLGYEQQVPLPTWAPATEEPTRSSFWVHVSRIKRVLVSRAGTNGLPSSEIKA